MSAAKLIAKGVQLLSRVPTSTLGSVVETIEAIVNGEPAKAERLARNAALSAGAKGAARARIKATRS